MNKNSFLLGSLVGFFFFSNLGAFAMSVSFDQEVSMKGATIATVKVWAKDDRMKAESEFQGMKLILLKNDKGSFTYNIAQKEAAKLPKAAEKTNLTAQLPRYMAFLEENNAIKIGAEKLDGRECDIYSFMDPVIKREAKAWIWREKKFPVKIEVESPAGATVVELKNIQFDIKMDDSDFELPSDVTMIEMPEAAPLPQTPVTPKGA